MQGNRRQCPTVGISAQEIVALRQVTRNAVKKEPVSVSTNSMLQQLAHLLLARRLISSMWLKRCELMVMMSVMSTIMTIMSQDALA